MLPGVWVESFTVSIKPSVWAVYLSLWNSIYSQYPVPNSLSFLCLGPINYNILTFHCKRFYEMLAFKAQWFGCRSGAPNDNSSFCESTVTDCMFNRWRVNDCTFQQIPFLYYWILEFVLMLLAVAFRLILNTYIDIVFELELFIMQWDVQLMFYQSSQLTKQIYILKTGSATTHSTQHT